MVAHTELASFTSNTLPILANWSQLLGGYALITAVIGTYLRHCCHIRRCWWPAWHPHPEHGHPVCFIHYPKEDRP